jgi:transcriptional regulator with XRE-family HTH domain
VPTRDDTTADSPTDSTEFGQRLRLERERQNIGVRELSRRLDVSASMISQIERGRVMPSVNTLYSITSALGISLDDLFARDPGAGRPRGTVNGGGAAEADAAPANPVAGGLIQRRSGRKAIELGSGVRWELLTTHPEENVEFLQTTYAVGGESTPADALMRHGGHEYGVVLTGRLGVTVGFETHELEPGDSISFTSSTPHRLFNLDPEEPTTAIWVVVGRRGDPRVR